MTLVSFSSCGGCGHRTLQNSCPTLAVTGIATFFFWQCLSLCCQASCAQFRLSAAMKAVDCPNVCVPIGNQAVAITVELPCSSESICSFLYFYLTFGLDSVVLKGKKEETSCSEEWMVIVLYHGLLGSAGRVVYATLKVYFVHFRFHVVLVMLNRLSAYCCSVQLVPVLEKCIPSPSTSSSLSCPLPVPLLFTFIIGHN